MDVTGGSPSAQPHNSRGRNAQGPAFAFSSVCQTRSDIFGLQLREFLQELSLGRTSRQVPKDIANGNAGSAHAGLSKPDSRIDADAFEEAHAAQSKAEGLTPAKVLVL